VSAVCAQKAGLRELNEKLDTIASSNDKAELPNTGSGICFNGGKTKIDLRAHLFRPVIV
jgi:hypothetical protein